MDIEKKRLADQIAITWACSRVFHTTDLKIGFSMAIKILKKVVTISEKCIFFPEVGNSGSNLHFHGVIWLKDKVKWFKSVLPTLKRNGYVKITTMNDNWFDYISKDWAIMRPVLDLDEPITEEYLKRIITIKKLDKCVTSQNIVDMVYGETNK